MEVYEMSGERVLQFFQSSRGIGQGAYGHVIPFTKDLLFKLYYSEFSQTMRRPTIERLEEEINHNKLWFGIKDFSELKKKCERLELCKKGTYLRGIVTYKNYPIGVVMKWYKQYRTLERIYCQLLNKEKKYVLSEVKRQLLELLELGIFATDVKEDNVLVHPKNLDTVLIDLDDDMTRYFGAIFADEPTSYSKDDLKEFRGDVFESYDAMVKNLEYFHKKV